MKDILYSREQFRCRTELRHRSEKEPATLANEQKVLEKVRQFVKTDHHKRHAQDQGYVESTLWLPYVKDDVVKELERDRDYYRRKIEKYNKLPWYKKIFVKEI